MEKLYQELENYRPPMYAIYFNAQNVFYGGKLSSKQSASEVFKSGRLKASH